MIINSNSSFLYLRTAALCIGTTYFAVKLIKGFLREKRKMDQEETDKISHLPEPLINKILSLLPIRDAVRTSILSRNWRFKWTTISNLVFDDKLFDTHGLVKIIDRVLFLHSGPVQKFMLSLKCSNAKDDIDIWIRHLSKASMTELILELWEPGPRYKVPSSLFYCEGLTSLRLSYCSVSIPVSLTFRGFKNLKILHLQSIISNDLDTMLDKLISGSDVIEDLTLINYQFYDFNYVAPKLKHFCFGGSLIEFSFGVRFNSTFCSPSFHMEYQDNKMGDAHSINLLKFFAPLRSVETLKLDGDVLKYLSVEEVPAVLTEPLFLLKNLFISGINFSSGKQLLVILCLLRSAPNLTKLKLLAAGKDEHTVEVDDDCTGIEICDSPSKFAPLNSVSLTGIGDSALEIGFIGIMLSSSPALQKITIKANAKFSELYPSGSGKCKLLKNMLRLQCVSTQVELILCDH